MKKSNLGAVKSMAISFLYLPIEETAFSPAVVQHPIFESALTAIKKDGEPKIVNILDNKDDYDCAIAQREEMFKNCDSVLDVYMMIRKSYRLTFLKFVEQDLSREDMSKLLADAWTTSENPNQDVNVSLTLATKWFKKADKHVLMDEEDYKVYESLPGVFKVYRGVSVSRNPHGMSWTVNKEKAVWFANRFNTADESGYVQAATAHKEDVLAYFNTMGEDEIVINTKSLYDIKIEK